jgi:hypothetical protein
MSLVSGDKDSAVMAASFWMTETTGVTVSPNASTYLMGEKSTLNQGVFAYATMHYKSFRLEAMVIRKRLL